jgi:hypothetical protein
MDMTTYLAEIRHAVASIIPVIWSEHAIVDQATAILRRHEEATRRGYEQSAAFMDELDDEGLATQIHWDTYFGPDKERHHAAEELAKVQATLEARTFSRSSLASSLLQYSKQGLSAVHGGLAAVPAGREIGGVSLKDVVWQGRNQGIHWEEGRPHPAVVECFEKLTAVDAAFGDYAAKNLAFEVVQLLGWRDVAAFEADLSSLVQG